MTFPAPDPASAVITTTDPFAIVTDRAAARSWLDQAIRYLEDMRRIRAETENHLNSQISESLFEALNDARQRRLQETLLTDLLKGQRVHGLATLASYGITSALDIERISRDQLLAFEGVGEQSADRIQSAVREVTNWQKQDLRLPADPTRWSNGQLSLARALILLARVGPLLGLPDLAWIDQVLSALRAAKRVFGVTRWLLGGRAAKRRAQFRYLTTQFVFTRPATLKSTSQIQQAAELFDSLGRVLRSVTELIRIWREDSATPLANLGRILTAHSDSTIAALAGELFGGAGALDENTARDILAMNLDCTLLCRPLRRYQEFGAKFALHRRRCLIGDEMGLGKTFQALAVAAHLHACLGPARVLVIAPASLISTWEAEVAKFVRIPFHIYGGNARSEALRRWMRDGGILATSYDLAQRDLAAVLPACDLVIVDEAHFVKNPTALRSIAVKQICSNASHVILMTGTPIENRAEEFIALTTHLSDRHASEIRLRVPEPDIAHRQPDRFRRAVAFCYLRRNQDDVLTEIPELISVEHPVDVTQSERRSYEAFIEAGDMMNARRALTLGDGTYSSKLDLLLEILDECEASGQKVLVYSFFVDVVKVVAERTGPSARFIVGDTPTAQRQQAIDWFRAQKGFACLAMTFGTGATGLNLQEASVVALMEPQFKPSIENQAVKRSHRQGQTRPVVVHRLIASRSVDEYLVLRNEEKQLIFDRLASESLAAQASDDATDPGVSNEQAALAYERERLKAARLLRDLDVGPTPITKA
jgi:superfamily II DNA or RNA helicase